jgi:aminoglycoside 3-N-acetyltransferase
MTCPLELRDLTDNLRALGVRPGQDLLVHSSMQRLGPIVGGAPALLDALQEVTGAAATIVVPTYTTGNSGSSTMFRAATRGLDRAEVARYLASMPGFDPRCTPSEGMGRFAEYVRTHPQASRSEHPQTSFAAIGPRAADCVGRHDLDCHLGERSPLGWLGREGAAILLLGVGYDKCTAFHLAEYRLPGERPRRAYHCVTAAGGERREHEFWDVDLDESDFAALGGRMDGQPFVGWGRVGAAECRLVPIPRAVAFAMSDPAFLRRRAPRSAPASPDPAPGGLAATARDARAAVNVPGRYFFISYPRLPPLPSVPGVDVADPPDEWVRAFFHDLSAEVGRRVAPGSLLRPGFLDVEVPAGSHWRSGLTEAIGAAEVFVPLLSPDYYRRSWPACEWMAVERRVRDADPGAVEPPRRFAPVLWEPLPPGEQPPALAGALSLATAGARELYADLGLRTLLRHPAYRWCYDQVLGELATRIVSIAEKTPIGPSSVHIPDASAPLGGVTGDRVFTVTVIGWHGRAGALPSDYVRLCAERRGFAVHVREFAAADQELVRHPGILLVEQEAAGNSGAVRDAGETIAALPTWVLPLVFSARPGGQPDETGIILEKAKRAYLDRPENVRHGLAGVGSIRELAGLAPFLIAHAEREYLRYSPVGRAASRPVFRPRLVGDGPRPDQPGKENPHV